MRAVPALVLPLLVACATDASGPGDPQTGGDPVPHASGSYGAVYDVPVPTDLEHAARFPVDSVDWTIVDGIATLHYALPPGLVGGELEITLSGPIETGSELVHVAGSAGTGSCTAVGTRITCREVFTGLGTLPIDQTVIEQRAMVEYDGPLHERLSVASMFASEPIGIVIFDVETPIADDDILDD